MPMIHNGGPTLNQRLYFIDHLKIHIFFFFVRETSLISFSWEISMFLSTWQNSCTDRAAASTVWSRYHMIMNAGFVLRQLCRHI